MTNQTKMTRQEMQDEALVIEKLLDTAQALFGTSSDQDMMTMVKMANARAHRLNLALDSVYAD